MGIVALGDETNDFVNNKIVDQLVKRWEDHGLKKELGASGIEKLYFNLPRQKKCREEQTKYIVLNWIIQY